MNFNIFFFKFGGFHKKEYLLGYEEIMDITKLDFFFWGGGVISVHFKAFLTVKVQIGIIFGVAKNSNILWGMPKFLIF